MGAFPVDLSSVGSGRAILSFLVNDPGLASGEYLLAGYWVDEWDAGAVVTVVGDGMRTTGWQRFDALFPAEVMARSDVGVFFERFGGSGCADVDEVVLLELPSARSSADLLNAGFDGGVLAPFAVDPVGSGDVSVVLDDGDWVAFLADNGDTSIWASIDTTSVEPMPSDQLYVTWRSAWSPTLSGADDYVLVEGSYDGGATWALLAATGLETDLDGVTQGVAFMPLAYYLTDFRIRFRAPSTASTGTGEGLLIDDIAVTAVRQDLEDHFTPVAASGSGTYRTSMSSGESGERGVACFWGCWPDALMSNWVDVDL